MVRKKPRQFGRRKTGRSIRNGDRSGYGDENRRHFAGRAGDREITCVRGISCLFLQPEVLGRRDSLQDQLPMPDRHAGGLHRQRIQRILAGAIRGSAVLDGSGFRLFVFGFVRSGGNGEERIFVSKEAAAKETRSRPVDGGRGYFGRHYQSFLVEMGSDYAHVHRSYQCDSMRNEKGEET